MARRRLSGLTRAAVGAACLTLAGVGSAAAQAGPGNAAAGPAASPAAAPLDLDAPPPRPLPDPAAASSGSAAVPPAAASLTVAPPTAPALPQPAALPAFTALPAVPAFTAPAALPPATLSLEHPQEIDPATLSSGGLTVALFGITALSDPDHGLQAYLQAEGDRLSCEWHPPAAGTRAGASPRYTCYLPDRTDVALVSLANGAAAAVDDAPLAYHAQEDAAQAARRGAWVNLPAPPVPVSHPVARTSALLVAAGQSFPLDGLVGAAGRPAQELQSYIASHGDALMCQPGGGRYVCTLPDGTDIAKVALINGAARVSDDAPDAYRQQQVLAQEAHRGIWATAAAPVMPAAGPPIVVGPPGGFAVEDVAGPVAYVGEEPTAVIDNEPVFFVYGDGLGWGYYDHFHHWRGAPERYANHLQRFHPEGAGLRGYGARGPGGEAFGRGGHPGFGSGGGIAAGFHGGPEGGFHAGGGPGGVRGGEFAHAGPGFGRGAPAFAHGGPAPSFAHGPAPQSFARGGPSPAFAHAAPAQFRSPAAFARPSPMPSMNRPAAMMAPRAVPAMRAPAPAMRAPAAAPRLHR